MRRSKLEKINFRNQTNESLKAYRKQKNYCRKRYRKKRKKFSDNLKLVFNLISEVSPNFRLDEEVLKTSWSRLSSSSSEDVFKTSWWRTLYLSWPSVFKTSSGRLAKMSSKHLQDDFKTPCEISSRRFQDVVKTFRRCHGIRKIITLKTCWRSLQDVLKTNKYWLGSVFFVRNVKLIEKEEILKDDTEIAEELSLFFSNSVKSLTNVTPVF